MINHGDRGNTQSANTVKRVIMNKAFCGKANKHIDPPSSPLGIILFDVNYSGDKESLKYSEAASIHECGIKYIKYLKMQVLFRVL